MKLTGFNGVLFSAAVKAKWDSMASPSASRNAVELARIGADPFVSGVEIGTQVVTASFTASAGSQIENALAGVLALLNPDRPVPGVLTGQMVDGTNVERTAVVGPWHYENVNTLIVDFICDKQGWRATASTALLAATTYTADGSFPNLNTGLRDVLPKVTAWPPSGGSNRGTKTATYGFANKVAYIITNTGSEPIINEPWQIGPVYMISGVPFSAGALLSGGNDLRVFCEGAEWPRNVIGFDPSNSGYGFIWVVIPFLAPQGTLTLEIVLNNASAGTPPTLSYSSTPALPAIDISGEFFASSSATGTTITKSTSTWVSNQWDGGTVVTKQTGPNLPQMRRVTGNTANQLTVSRAFGTTPSGHNCTVIKSGLMGDGGTASGVSGTTLTDSSQSWSTNEWIGATVDITGGTGLSTTGTVVSNTSTTLTVASWSSTAPATSSTFNVYRKNGVWLYDVRRTSDSRSGLWNTNRTASQPSQVNFDAPASWYRFVLQRGRDNYSQPRADNPASPLWHAVMRLRRSRRGKQGDQTEVGIADAVGVSCPFGIIGTQFAYSVRNAKKAGSNPAAGMCEFKGVCQESGGEVWATFLSDTAQHDSTANVTDTWYDLTGYGYPIRMGMALVPNANDEIPDTDNNTAEVRSISRYLKIAVNPNNVLAETNQIYPTTQLSNWCYDVNLRIRTGGGSGTRPFSRMEIGATGHRLFLAQDIERLVIDCETHRIYLTDASGAYIKDVPWAVQPQEVIDDQNANATAVVASRWLPIPPSSIDAANIYFSDPSGAGWGNFRIQVDGKFGYIL